MTDMSISLIDETDRILAPNWQPGMSGIKAITIYKRTGDIQRIERAKDERYILIDPRNVGESGKWGIWTARFFQPLCWNNIDRIEIEHLGPLVAA